MLIFCPRIQCIFCLFLVFLFLLVDFFSWTPGYLIPPPAVEYGASPRASFEIAPGGSSVNEGFTVFGVPKAAMWALTSACVCRSVHRRSTRPAASSSCMSIFSRPLKPHPNSPPPLQNRSARCQYLDMNLQVVDRSSRLSMNQKAVQIFILSYNQVAIIYRYGLSSVKLFKNMFFFCLQGVIKRFVGQVHVSFHMSGLLSRLVWGVSVPKTNTTTNLF